MVIEDLIVDGLSLLVLLGCFLYAHHRGAPRAMPARARAADTAPGPRGSR